VDGFFAVSGFLIARSWITRPSVTDFLAARAARIFPAFWVCLIVTATLIRPLSDFIVNASVNWTSVASEGFRYVTGNASLVIFEHGIGATPSGVPWAGDWNASLWTLKWEFLCYLGVIALGLLGLVARRRFMSFLLGAAWLLSVVVTLSPLGESHSIEAASRFFLMFACGAFLSAAAPLIPMSRGPVVGSVVFALGCAVLLPDYRLVASLPLAYAAVGVGALVRTPTLKMPNDLSYGIYVYGFPVEQLLGHSEGIRGLGPVALGFLALALTVPFAAASWFLVEKPTLRRVRQLRRARSQSTAARAVVLES
jgi:peptidoglycan/LPS O-acetylase OafA/YrhL